jgi:Flp pilus assembly protein TadD/cell division septation protein DedD
MNLKVSAVPTSFLQCACFAALIAVSASTAQAADKPAVVAKPAASTPEAPPSALGLVPGEIPSDLETALHQAQTSRQSGDLAEASKILSQLVLFAPDDPRVLAEYGKTLVAEGRTNDALAFLERAIQLQPAEWSNYSAQGIAFDQKGNYQAAMTSYTRALALKPGEPTVLNNAAMSRMQAGDLAGAEKYLMQAAPGAAEFPRISENLALLQSMKEARATPVMPQLAPAVPAPAPFQAMTAPVVEKKPLPEPQKQAPPVMTASAAPPPAMPVMPSVEPAVAMPKESEVPAPVAEESSPPASMPEAQPNAPASKSLAELRSDPSVRMAPVPKDDQAGKVVKTVPPKPAAPTVAAAAPAPAPAPVKNVQLPVQKAGTATSFYVQAGAFATQSRADEAAAALDSLGARVTPATVDGHAIFRVRIGPFLDVSQANAAVSHAQALGHTDLRIVNE